jgi:signal transduction histidine kinase
MSSSETSGDARVEPVFADILAGLAAHSHTGEFLRSALREAIRATASQGGSLLLMDDRVRRVREGQITPEVEEQISRWEDALGQTLDSSTWRFTEGQSPPVSTQLADSTNNLLVSAPLLETESVVGSITLVFPPGESLSLSRRQVLTSCSRTLAGLAGVIDQLAATQRGLERLTFLYETSQALTSTLELQTVLDDTMELATSIIEAQASTLMLIDEETNELVFDIPYGEKRELLRSYRMPLGEGIAGWVATHGEPAIVNETSTDDRFSRDTDVRTGFLTQSVICVPLQIKDRTIGVLEALNKKSADGFSEDDLRLLSTLAAQASIAIENARLYRSLREERDRIISVQEEARRSLARDLHDTTLQRLSSISMGIDHVKQLLKNEPEAAEHELERVQGIVSQASREARVLLFELRPIVLETQGLVPALESYVTQLQSDELPRFHFDGGGFDQRLSSDIELTAFLIVQEAVNNARKHAGADNVWLQLGAAEDSVSITVEDDGTGFDEPTALANSDQSTHLGLVSMQERAHLIHARLEIESTPDQGTRVVLVIPR